MGKKWSTNAITFQVFVEIKVNAHFLFTELALTHLSLFSPAVQRWLLLWLQSLKFLKNISDH